MNIQNYGQNINFGHKVPADILIKAALKKMSYEDAKALNQSIGVRYSGHIGFHKRALAIAEKVCKQDENFKKTVEKIAQITNPFEREKEIQKITAENGGMIDITL